MGNYMNSSSFIVSFDVFCNQGLVFQNGTFSVATGERTFD